jgi:molybdopterin/thiamine biosynthesis adenylyltransferase
MSSGAFKEISPLRSLQPIAAPRAARLPAFVGMQPGAGTCLDDLTLMGVGCGSVGSTFMLHAARLKPRALYLVDHGLVKPESLLTHVCVMPEHIGKPKASLVGHLCGKSSPETRVYAYDGNVQSLSPAAFAKVDLVMLASDNLACEVEVAQQCLRWGKPLIQAAVHGDTLTAQVRCFSHASEETACLRCGFSEAEEAALNRQVTFSCQGVHDATTHAPRGAEPTVSTSFLCSMAAELALVQAVRLVLGLGKPSEDCLIEYCGYTHRTVLSPLKRNPKCLCDHQPFQLGALPWPRLGACTTADLCKAAGAKSGDSVALSVGDDLSFVETGHCGCIVPKPIGRFCSRAESLGHCPDCGSALLVHAASSHRPASPRALAGRWDTPLGEIGAASARWAQVYLGDRVVVFLDPSKGGN